jgi:4-amino-4-deoxy-L-arabinose transferase-like glycosyltransferase
MEPEPDEATTPQGVPADGAPVDGAASEGTSADGLPPEGVPVEGSSSDGTPASSAEGSSLGLPRGLGGLCIALFVALALHGAWTKSETYDEPMTLLAGWSYVQTGDFSFNREHPPLAKLLMGLALLPLDPVLPESYQTLPAPAYTFFTRQPEVSPQAMLFAARLPGILLGILLLLYVRRWATTAFGPTAGLAALVLVATNPNVIAHARVAGNDFACAVFMFAACYHGWRWLAEGGRRSMALLGLTLGLALGSKLTALLLLPLLGLAVLACAISRRKWGLLAQGLVVLLAAGGVLWLLYMGEARTLAEAREHARFQPRGASGVVFSLGFVETTLASVFGADTPIPLLSFLKAIDHQFQHAAHGHMSYFWGDVGAEGHPAFYVVTGALKNPIGLVLLVLVGWHSLRRTGRGVLHETFLHGASLFMLLLFSRADVQLGFKYMLPAVPFLAVMGSRLLAPGPGGKAGAAPVPEAVGAAALFMAGGAGLALLFDEPGGPAPADMLPVAIGLALALTVGWRARQGSPVALHGSALVLVTWAALSSLSQHPHQLVYFNEWAGGPDRGTWYSVVGDDWGQDTALLGRWMERQGVDEITYDYYGTGDPQVWGVRSKPSWAGLDDELPTGLFAVNVALLRRLPDAYAFLGERKPIASLGHTIRVFDLDAVQD